MSGSEQDIICFELTPGTNTQRNVDMLEEVYFLHITHWDNYDSALNSRQPAGQSHRYDIQIPYFGGQYDPERVMSDIYMIWRKVSKTAVSKIKSGKTNSSG